MLVYVGLSERDVHEEHVTYAILLHVYTIINADFATAYICIIKCMLIVLLT